MTKAVLTITDAAAARIKTLLEARDKPAKGVRITVKTRGCNGYAYALEYVDAIQAADEIVQDKGVTVLVDPKATLFIIGSEMDFVEENLESGFTFRNPNAKGHCGCGESFHV